MTQQPGTTSQRIVVGVDGSPSSLDALRWAAQQAELTGAQLEAVTAWEFPVQGAGFALLAGIDWADNARTTQATALEAALGARGSAVIRTVREGHPVRVLRAAADGAALLVVGSRGHGGFAGLMLGSVSEHVVAHAPCPVLVIRHLPVPEQPAASVLTEAGGGRG